MSVNTIERLRVIEEARKENYPKYVPFRLNESRRVLVDGRLAIEYIPPYQLFETVAWLASQVDFNDYNILVNENGGSWLYNQIAFLQGYNGPYTPIEYKRSKGGFGVDKVRQIPQRVNDKPNLVVEDIIDSGYTLRGVEEDDPFATCLCLCRKVGIKDQYVPRNAIVGLELDNWWLYGGGMNVGQYAADRWGYDPEHCRNAYALLVVPEHIQDQGMSL